MTAVSEFTLDLTAPAVDNAQMIYRRGRSWVVILFTALLIIFVNLAWWLFYIKTEQSFDGQLSRRLTSVARLGAARFEPGLIGELIDGYLRAYDEVLDKLEQIKAVDSLSEVFILYSDHRYLATTSMFLDTDSTYYLAALNRASLDSAFSLGTSGGWSDERGRAAVTAGYRVGDTYLKSAFAPLYDSTGLAVALLGVEADVEYTEDLNALRGNLYLSSILSIGAGLLFGLFFFIVQRRIIASDRSVMLSQSQANLGRMVAVVSHEIKNPLMIIRASAESLRKKNPARESDFILEEIDRLNRIVTGYLDFASGNKVLKKEMIAPGDLLETIIAGFGARLAADGVNLVREGESMAATVTGDLEALRQVIINLVLNGADAARRSDPARVAISVTRDNRKIRINITDSGPGIERKKLKNIFEPFYTTKTTGSGLGLYHSRRLVEAMGGRITVASRHGGPTTFSIILPAAGQGE